MKTEPVGWVERSEPHRPDCDGHFLRRLLGHPLCLVLLLALLVRGGVLLLTPGALQDDPDGYRRLAENLVACGTFGDNSFAPLPLDGPKGTVPFSLTRKLGPSPVCSPSAYRPPLYPLLLTPCVALSRHLDGADRLGGTSLSGSEGRGSPSAPHALRSSGRATRPPRRLVLPLAIGVLHVVMGLATVWLVFVLGRWWGLGDRGAAAAGLLVVCDPILLAQSTRVMTETPAALLAVVGLLALTRLSSRVKTTSALLAGAALALGVLCRPEFLLWLITAGAVLWLRLRRVGACTHAFPKSPEARGCKHPPYISAARSLAAFAMGAAIVLSPWAIRNQIQFRRPIVTTTHGGYTLLLANNPDFYQWLRSGPWGSVWRSDALDATWRAQRPSNELEADRLAYQEAWASIRQQPGSFAYACLVRLGRLWSPLPHQIISDESPTRRLAAWAIAAWYLAVFLLAALGLCRMARGSKYGIQSAERSEIAELPAPHPSSLIPHPSSFAWGLLLVACVTAVHTIYWTDMRMRGPLMAVVAISAAAGLFGWRRPE